MDDCDLLIVGGGINGAGIARDAAGRGLSVLLVEQGDLAGATSSASSKLIHGGLRYLEQYEFRLVREALAEREVLLGSAPHIIRPLRFVLPHDRSIRPLWLIRLGLLLYDHLGGRRTLPATERIHCRTHRYGTPLHDTVTDAFAYSDCWVDDARLVVLNARAAAALGAAIETRSRLVAAQRDGATWLASVQDRHGTARIVRARALVNAAGPWVADVIGRAKSASSQRRMRLIKGSHIVVERLHDGDQAYILQNDDRRIVFVLPYQERFSLIGTTDVAFDGDPAAVAITPDEVDYLCAAVSRWFATPVTSDRVVASYAGVRPLYDDHAASASTVTRDYVLDLDAPAGQAPLLSVFGGKITTFRRLAEHALDKLKPSFPTASPAWTRGAVLPGGDLPGGSLEHFIVRLRERHGWLPVELARRLARSYGTDALEILGGATRPQDLGLEFGAGLTAREVDWLVAHEWARTVDDVLWRRTKLGLTIDAAGAERLRGYLAAKLPASVAALSATG
ncbi:MAG: glycerol-3-phosphate dehydrogenase [Proteobacteria bacterium]|nr:glycerol-3-phosphate dehydrogenase [Pseudomonadota bacterium]